MKLPAGSYYVGDPCYAIGADGTSEWTDLVHQLCASTQGKHIQQGAHRWKGQQMWLHKTSYGDGGYYDQHGREYSVDSGMLAAVPAALCNRYPLARLERLGKIVIFHEPFACSYRNGLFKIGHIRIQT